MTPMQYELHQARKERLQRMKAWHGLNVVPLHKVRPRSEPDKVDLPLPEPEVVCKPQHTSKNRELTPLMEIASPEILDGGAITIRQIQDVVAQRYKVDVSEMRSNSHRIFVTLPRQIAYTLARRVTGKALPTIAKVFGRDHTTILQGIRKIEKRASIDAEFAAELVQLEQTINGQDAVAFPVALSCIE